MYRYLGPSWDEPKYIKPSQYRPEDASEEGGVTYCTSIGPSQDSTCCLSKVRRFNTFFYVTLLPNRRHQIPIKRAVSQR